MRLLLDQNISYRVVRLLEDDFGVVSHIKDENLTDASDLHIRSFAMERQFTIITYDDDFIKYNHLYGPPPKIIWIRRGNLFNHELAALLVRAKTKIELFISTELVIGVLEII